MASKPGRADLNDLPETLVERERWMFRLHRLKQPREAQYLRMAIQQCQGECPTVREVEFYAEPSAAVEFPDWAIVVNTEEGPLSPENSHLFVSLIRQCEDWKQLLFQQIAHADMDEAFAAAEPRPLCALLTGSGRQWCQFQREPWRGMQEVLKNRNLPIWGACGGAQILAILEDTGVDKPWDCPRCRDPTSPKSPIYTHIGHTGPAKCGDFSKNLSERGKYKVRIVARDPAFEGLPELFETMEAHYGQIAYLPKGWVRVVTKGSKGVTENQCIQVADRYIYAAQFHIERPGTPETSQKIMSNFLKAAKRWGGYNPNGKPVPPPEPLQ
ncbi:MAG: hypothetical protein NZ602_15500 [Thermoguttaceae bacterium]|nr:hypothetical protein [Thermoguttaceae bacterium]MDW8039505.1 hypothetical protein [Thermoguttaceae bacterium]